MAFLWSMGDKGKVLARCFTSLTKNNLSESCIMHSERWGFLLVGGEMPLSCCHKTKVCLGEMYGRDSKVLSIRFISPFCCTALGLMWAVSSMGSAPAHISLTIKNICSLTMASQGKGWSNSTADSTQRK